MLLSLWNKLSPLPFGSRLFSFILCLKVPYTGSIHPHVFFLERGRVKVRIHDKRRLRNHLESIHAVALMNVAEIASGLSVMTTLGSEMRAIVTHFEIEFIKKGRGTLISQAEFAGPSSTTERRTYKVESIVTNSDGDIVAKAHATWLIGPKGK